jgi:hypothetical protein
MISPSLLLFLDMIDFADTTVISIVIKGYKALVLTVNI